MSNLFKKAGSALTYLGGGLTLITFVQGIQTNSQNKFILESLKKRIDVQNSTLNNYEKTIKENSENTLIKSKVAEIEDCTNQTLSEQNNINNIIEKLKDPNLTQNESEILTSDHHLNNQTNNLKDGTSKIEELKNIIEQISSSKSGSGSTNNLISLSDWQEYVSSLPLEKIGALGHILLSLAIIFSLFSILTNFYGDILIKKYKIEDKFPMLARFIILRRKFQNYYLLINSIFMFVSLLLIIYVNFVVFIS